ncbi:hypothetical protein [Streptomyces sclerotialus]|uniref:hypothetical protein n=1 Tax=Streptomyces sclerotialus TaxID=1957 RepID=UPI00068AF070
MATSTAPTAHGYALLIAADPPVRRPLPATTVLPQLAAVPPAHLVGAPFASAVQLANPDDPNTVLTHIRTAAAVEGPLLIYVAGHLQVDSRQGRPHLALARTAPRTVRYTALPWHWLTAELQHRPPGSTTVLADLAAAPEVWQQLGEGRLSLGGPFLLYGTVQRGDKRVRPAPAYTQALAQALRTTARRPGTEELHGYVARTAALDGATTLWLGGPPVPEGTADAWVAAPPAASASAPVAPGPVGAGPVGFDPASGPVGCDPASGPVASGPVVPAAYAPAVPAPAPVPVEGPVAAPEQASAPAAVPAPGSAPAPEPVAEAAPVPAPEPEPAVEASLAPEPAVEAPPAPESAPAPVRAPEPEPDYELAPAATDVPPAPEASGSATPEASGSPAPEASGSATPDADGPATVPPMPARPPIPVVAAIPPVPGAAPAEDPHHAVFAAAAAGRHGEAAAMAAAWEQAALRSHGPVSSEAVHWIEVQAELARLAEEPVRASGLWMRSAHVRLAGGQSETDPEVTAAVDRAHHCWHQVSDHASIRDLGVELANLRDRVPGKSGARDDVQRRLTQLTEPAGR